MPHIPPDLERSRRKNEGTPIRIRCRKRIITIERPYFFDVETRSHDEATGVGIISTSNRQGKDEEGEILDSTATHIVIRDARGNTILDKAVPDGSCEIQLFFKHP